MSSLPLFDYAAQAEERESEPVSSERVYRVSEINRAVRQNLETGWADVWVEGELSDVKRAATGHVYFTLNDEKQPAQLSAVMFRGDARNAACRFEDGERVRVKGALSLYEPRGRYQMLVRAMRAAGVGDLRAQFDKLRKKLEAEGLLDAARKRALPMVPRCIGVVTSASGAALHDIVRVARGRCAVRIIVSPCSVQGEAAPGSIVEALERIQRMPEVEAVIVGRGGGSAEDLVAFNDERVARAIIACRVPTVSAVGHEVDVTIADLVADVRAATPSNAAELVVPSKRELLGRLAAHERGLQRAMDVVVGRLRLTIERLSRAVLDPTRGLGAVRARLEQLATRMERALRRELGERKGLLRTAHDALTEHNPRLRLARDRARLISVDGCLEQIVRALLERRAARLRELMSTLDALSPLSILNRGYAIALDATTGRAVRSHSDVAVGSDLELRLHEGRIAARVTSTRAD